MSTHLVLAYAAIPDHIEPDWTAAERLAREFDFRPFWSPEHDSVFGWEGLIENAGREVGDDELEDYLEGAVRERLLDDLDAFRRAVRGHRNPDLVRVPLREVTLYLTGRLGPPSYELHNVMRRLCFTGVLEAAGFIATRPSREPPPRADAG